MQDIPEGMMIGEGFSSGAIGVMISLAIAWLREKGFLSNRDPQTTKFLTLVFSYVLAAVTTVGIHWTVSGDFVTGGSMTIHWPDAGHMLQGLTTFASNIVGQKGYAQLNRIAQSLSVIADANMPPDPKAAERKLLEEKLAALNEKANV